MVKATGTPDKFRAALPGSRAAPRPTPGVVLVFQHSLWPCPSPSDRSLGWTICLDTILHALPAPGPCCHPPPRTTSQSSAWKARTSQPTATSCFDPFDKASSSVSAEKPTASQYLGLLLPCTVCPQVAAKGTTYREPDNEAPQRGHQVEAQSADDLQLRSPGEQPRPGIRHQVAPV